MNNNPLSGATGNCTWQLAGPADNYTLLVSGTGAMKDYAFDALPPWHPHRDAITTLLVADGVTSLGDLTCKDCTRLLSVSLPSTLARVGRWAFSGCSSLRAVDLPATLDVIDAFAFCCSGLHSVVIPDSVTHVASYAFWHSALRDLTLGRSNVIISDAAFSACPYLAVVTNHNPDPSSFFFPFLTPDVTVRERVGSRDRLLRVPAASLAAYRVVGEWRHFGAIEAIPDDDPSPPQHP
ncbi:MAG: leucine-rich repeat domain-containing protein [Odoribacteraceae bacterium]|jgi:hypothetical protein|nr:leucine-rich repeat domain-containing protein [Odoribacteraceae bacterium]